MTGIILQIYIEQTKHPTTVKTYIIIYVIMYVVRFKIYEWLFSGLAENSPYWYLDWVQIRSTVDIKFLQCARSPSLLIPFGKMSIDFDGRKFSMWSSVLKYWSMSFADWLLRVIALALGFEADIRRAWHKQYTYEHRIWLVKLWITYFWYKLFKLLTFRMWSLRTIFWKYIFEDRQ